MGHTKNVVADSHGGQIIHPHRSRPKVETRSRIDSLHEERWTGAYIFTNEWPSFSTRQKRELEMTTAPHIYGKPGRHTVAVKAIDIFGNDTMTLMSVTAG